MAEQLYGRALGLTGSDREKLATLGQRYLKSADPTVNDDTGEGYEVWDKWLNQTSGEAYVCLDATEGAADWQNMSLDADDLSSLFDAKVDKVTGSSLVVDTEIAKIHTQNTDTNLGTLGTKATPADADKVIHRDSEDSDAVVTSTWTQVKAFLKTYFDTLYGAATLGANTFTDTQTLGAGASIALNEKTILVDAALSTDGTWTGPTQSVTAGEILTVGEVAYLKSDGKYWLADADAEATADTKLVMATATIAADATGVVLLPSPLSFMRVDATTEWTVTGAGDVMYLSTVAGELTNDVSGYTTGDIIRVCGYMETSTVLAFDVDKTFVEVA